MTYKFVRLAQEIEKLEAELPISDSRDFLLTRCSRRLRLKVALRYPFSDRLRAAQDSPGDLTKY